MTLRLLQKSAQIAQTALFHWIIVMVSIYQYLKNVFTFVKRPLVAELKLKMSQRICTLNMDISFGNGNSILKLLRGVSHS